MIEICIRQILSAGRWSTGRGCGFCRRNPRRRLTLVMYRYCCTLQSPWCGILVCSCWEYKTIEKMWIHAWFGISFEVCSLCSLLKKQLVGCVPILLPSGVWFESRAASSTTSLLGSGDPSNPPTCPRLNQQPQFLASFPPLRSLYSFHLSDNQRPVGSGFEQNAFHYFRSTFEGAMVNLT